MLQTHPTPSGIDLGALASCIEACFECAFCCTACADACLAEDVVADMRFCIRQDLDCADVCVATGRILSRQTQPDWALMRWQVEACRTACQRCHDECAKHAGKHAHCKRCADNCSTCADACTRLLSAIDAVA